MQKIKKIIKLKNNMESLSKILGVKPGEKFKIGSVSANTLQPIIYWFDEEGLHAEAEYGHFDTMIDNDTIIQLLYGVDVYIVVMRD